MTKRISRRQFLQATGLAGTTLAISGCTLNLQRSETIEPYVTPPEEALPGENVWYASTCRMCPEGCGIIVRVSNGRARKIEGNPNHPLNAGRLCAAGQAGLQLLYNPDRLQNAVRNEARGTGALPNDPFARGGGLKATPLQWEDALTQVADRVKAARAGGVAFYGSRRDDSLAAVVGPFVQALGGAAVFYDSLGAYGGRNPLQRTMSQLYGGAGAMPFFDIANADVVLAFGGLLDAPGSSMAYQRAYGEMRGGRLGKRGYLVACEPRMSPTAAVADEWLPITPGTEGLVALALGRILVDERRGAAAESPAAGLFVGVDVANAASLAGVTEERLVKLARMLADYPRSVAVPGGALGGHTNAQQTLDAIMGLNTLLGVASGGANGVVTLTPPAPDPLLASAPASSYADVQALVSRMAAGEVDVLFVYGNPRYELPPETGFVAGLAKVPFVVSFSSEVDETALLADLILPDNVYLESWGFQVAAPAPRGATIGGQQPVVQRLYDTRATTDVFLDLARRVGGAAQTALPYANTVEFMKAALAKLVGQNAAFDTKNVDALWAGFRQAGGWWPTQAAPGLPAGAPALPASLAAAPADFVGGPDEYPYYLVAYPSVTLGDGRGASASWLQEAPDPMTTASWDTWVEINPQTAEALGVARDDVVKVISPTGEVSAIVYIYPAIRPDTVAMPLGQGHIALGRFAANRGANVVGILPSTATAGGDLAWASTRVRIEKLNRTRTLPRLENNVGVDAAQQYEKFPG